MSIICPECGNIMTYDRRPNTITYKGCEMVVKVLGWWCCQCGEGILSEEPLLVRKEAFEQFKARVDGINEL